MNDLSRRERRSPGPKATWSTPETKAIASTTVNRMPCPHLVGVAPNAHVERCHPPTSRSRARTATWVLVPRSLAAIFSAHEARDGKYARLLTTARETGQTFDLIVVGGGFSALGSASRFHELRRGTVLVLDNQRVWDGEAKRNESLVDGVRLIGPQGSNETFSRSLPGFVGEYSRALGIPETDQYQS